MSVIIDIIGATIAGSLLVLTILATIFNVHEVNYNIQMLLSMNHHGKNVQNILDTRFIERAGQFLNSSELPVFSPNPDSTNSTRMTYHYWDTIGRVEYLRYTVSTEELAGEDIGNAFSVQVHRVNGSSLNLEFDSYPFFLATNHIFRYYGYEIGDENGNGISNEFFELDSAPLNVSRIRAVRIDLVFHTMAFDRATGQNLVYPLSFWRIFTNAYILNNA